MRSGDVASRVICGSPIFGTLQCHFIPNEVDGAVAEIPKDGPQRF
jgi:hypothetical protein